MRSAAKILFAILCAFPLCVVGADGAEPKPGSQQGQTFEETITYKANLRYQLFVPESYGKEKEKKWPLLVFLHGSGESGENVELVKLHGPPKIVQEKKDFPFIVLSPQTEVREFWDYRALLKLLDKIQKQYNVDEDRVYLTGLSLGGLGTWKIAAMFPERFAAIVPICGWYDPAKAASLKNVPVWAFHGDKDSAVSLKGSQEMVEAINKAGGSAKITVYPGVGHDSWTQTYNNDEVYQWLLSQKRKK